MFSPRLARRTILGLLWSYVLWYSWTCCGLAGDGSYFLLEIVRQQGFLPFEFHSPRAYANFLAQAPAVAAVKLGIVDLQWLARIFSFGWIGLPAALYSLAVLRAGDDAVTLAATIASVAIVFMTTSFFVVAEHIPAYALATLAGVWILTAGRLETLDGLILVTFAILALRTYEAFVYFGPLLAAMTLWNVGRVPARPFPAVAVHLAAAGLFVAGGVIAGNSIVEFDDVAYTAATLAETRSFWRNLQLDLAAGAALIVVTWGLARPTDLAGARPYKWAGGVLAMLALTPLLVVADRVVAPPYGYQQQAARLAAGPVVAAIVAILWLRASRLPWRPAAFDVLRAPGAARRLLSFACLMVVATLPWNLMLTGLYVAYIDAMRGIVVERSGHVAFEEAGLAGSPRLLQGDGFALPILSRILGRGPGDGIVLPPQDYRGWQPFTAQELPDLAGYGWR